MKFCHGRSWFTRVELTIWNVLSLWKIWLKKNILEILTNTFPQPRSQGLNPDLGKAGIKALGTSLIRPQVNVYSLPFTQFADNPGCLNLVFISRCSRALPSEKKTHMTLNWALCAQCMHRVSCFLYASSWFCNEETVFSPRSFHRPRKREDRTVNKTLNMCQGVFWAWSPCVIISCELLNDVWKRCKREIFERYEGVKTNRERQFVSLAG